MGKRYLSKNEMLKLAENPYVKSVTRKRIMYTDEFKLFFMDSYLQGGKPTKIFKSAGFDVSVLGPKRIERAAARWREAYRKGTLKGCEGDAKQDSCSDASEVTESHEASETDSARQADYSWKGEDNEDSEQK